jgi:Alpha-L-arabinofuranosidase B (ABFB) domain/Astacin (Peptidase family M12A)
MLNIKTLSARATWALCVSAALLAAGCGGSDSTQEEAATAALPAPDAQLSAEHEVLQRSQHPEGQKITVRLPTHDEPVALVIKDGLAFLGDQVKGHVHRDVHGDLLVDANEQPLIYLDGRPAPQAKAKGDPRLQGSGIIRNPELKWPGGVIAYEFDASATATARSNFLAAKADYDAKTAIRLVPRNSSHTHYVRVVSKDGCYSYVGRTGLAARSAGQELSLGNGCGVNAARHEIGHALGLAHEQVRQDRDQWVVVTSTSSQDVIDRGAAGVPIGAYDFESMMHYNNRRLADGRWVYQPKTSFPPERVGNGRVNTFTPGDLATIAALYGPAPGGNPPGGQGVSLPLGTWVSMQVVTPGITNRFLRHYFSDGFTDVVNSNSPRLLKEDASWRIVAALDGTPCYSFESRNYPGHFLRHSGYRLRKHVFENNETYRKDATFCAQTGLAGEGGISLVSRNFPNHYIRHRSGQVWLDKLENQRGDWLDASWNLTSAWVP